MASEAIGSLFVSLGLDTAAFSAGVRQAQNKVEAFAGNLSKRLGALANVPGIASLQSGLAAIGVGAGAALGVGAAAAGVGLGALSINAMNAAHEIKNLSSLANATPEEFQKLAHAAASVGIEQGKLSDILKDVNDRVGDFIATGGGPMKDFFEKIAPQVGVTAEQFRKLSGPEALQLYVSSLEKANVNQQDFAFFMEAMASDSTALVPLLRNGGAAAQAYADRLVALGGVMSNDMVAKLSAMKTSLSEVGLVISGLGMQLGAAFAPIIQALAVAFTSAFTKGTMLRDMFDALSAGIARFAEVIAAVINIVGSLVGAIANIVGAAAAWANELTGIGSIVTWLWDHTAGFALDAVVWFSDLVRVTGGFAGALAVLGDIAAEVFARIGMSLGALVPAAQAVGAGMMAAFAGALADMTYEFQKFLTQTAKDINSMFGTNIAEPDITGVTNGLLNIKDGFEATAASAGAAASAAMAAATAPLQSLAGINDQIAASGNAAAAAMTGLGSGIAAAGDEAGGGGGGGGKGGGIKKLKDEVTELQKATEEWRDTMKSAFTDFITIGGSFKNVLSEIIGKLAEMIASSAFDQLFSKGGGNGLLGGVLSFFGIGANANGTNDWSGGLTRVNERGGEIMNLPSGTQIIPHDVSKRMASNSGGGMVDVRVSVDNNGNLQAYINKTSGDQVRAGVGAYDTHVAPTRIKRVSASPRRVGN